MHGVWIIPRDCLDKTPGVGRDHLYLILVEDTVLYIKEIIVRAHQFNGILPILEGQRIRGQYLYGTGISNPSYGNLRIMIMGLRMDDTILIILPSLKLKAESIRV
jgi:hypothetical protein